MDEVVSYLIQTRGSYIGLMKAMKETIGTMVNEMDGWKLSSKQKERFMDMVRVFREKFITRFAV